MTQESTRLDFTVASMDDARDLYDWRIDPGTRASSHTTDAFGYDHHVSWLEASLANANRDICIVRDGERKVGTIRADYDPETGCTALGWTIAPDCRGQGYGKRALQDFLRVRDGIVNPYAEIKHDNAGSVAMAVHAGLVHRIDGDAHITLYRDRAPLPEAG